MTDKKKDAEQKAQEAFDKALESITDQTPNEPDEPLGPRRDIGRRPTGDEPLGPRRDIGPRTTGDEPLGPRRDIGPRATE